MMRIPSLTTRHAQRVNASHASHLWQRLTDPPDSSLEPERRRRARSLASLLLFLIPLIILEPTLKALTDSTFNPMQDVKSTAMMSTAIVLLMAYGLGRTKHYIWGAWLTVSAFSIVPFIMLLTRADYSPNGITVSLIWIVLALLLGSLLFSLPATIILVGGMLGGILLLLVFIPEVTFQALLLPLGFLIGVSMLVVVAASVRRRDLMQIRQQSRELSEKEERFRSFFEATIEGIAVHQNGVVLDVNNAFSSMFGYALSEVRGRPLLEFLAEESRADVMNKTHSGGGEPIGAIGRRKDGTTFMLEIVGKQHSYRGRTAQVTALRDISKREHVERRLQVIMRAVETSSDAIAIFNAVDQTFYYNPTFIRLFGYSAEELTAAGGALSPCKDQRVVEEVREALDSGLSWGGEVDVETRDGKSLTIALRADAIKDDRGEVIGRVGTFVDITERKWAERALRESEKKYRALFEQIPDPIFVHDTATHHFIDCNQSVTRVYGYSLDEMRSMTPFDFHPSGEAVNVQHNIKVRDINQAFTTKHVTKAGRAMDVEILSHEIEYQGIPARISIVRDITERKRAERALAEKTRELERSNAELEQFAYVASHDLQEPLRMITSYLQLLTRRYQDALQAEAREFIQFAVDGASRMQTLINDLLMYSRVGTRAKPLEVTDCNHVLARALDNLKVAIEESGAGVTHEALPTIMGDATQLTQLFQNLIGNAIKFRGQKPPQIHIGLEQDDGEWVFSVKDNGIGLDPKYADQIFQIFKRLHSREEYAGTGIGLAVCKRIVERHGGRIWVESRPGAGSTFYFTIPAR